MTEPNPYAPPESSPDRPGRRFPWSILIRVILVVSGFSLVADPTISGLLPDRRPAQVAARLIGAGLLLGGFFSLRKPDVQPDQDL